MSDARDDVPKDLPVPQGPGTAGGLPPAGDSVAADSGPRAPGEAPEDAANIESDEPSTEEIPRARRVVRRAVHGAADVVDTVESAGRSVGHLAAPVVRRVRPRMGAAARRWRNRQAARNGRLRALNHEPLPNLYDLHPEARLAPVRELGLRTIPVAEIAGTAVEGSVQRGRDFLPPPPLRTQNWVGRWQRIVRATESLAVLPPIDVLKAAGAYWVVDGHNRVAAALYANQVAIDALVRSVRLPGDPIEVPGSLASMLSQADELDGVGRFSRPSFEPPPAPLEPDDREEGPTGAEPDDRHTTEEL